MTAEWEARQSLDQREGLATVDTYRYWSKAAYRTIEEAVALLLEREPRIITLDLIFNVSSKTKLGVEFLALRDLAVRARTARQIATRTSPGDFLAWASRNRIAVPTELEAAVTEHGHPVADWKSHEVTAEKVRVLEAEVSRLNKLSDENDPKKTSTRERESLLKMIIGMATKGYAYDPAASRTSTAKEIVSDLHELGLSLDEDTVRKYLKEAKDLLPRGDADKPKG